jgi:hypothetical protein
MKRCYSDFKLVSLTEAIYNTLKLFTIWIIRVEIEKIIKIKLYILNKIKIYF